MQEPYSTALLSAGVPADNPGSPDQRHAEGTHDKVCGRRRASGLLAMLGMRAAVIGEVVMGGVWLPCRGLKAALCAL